MQAFSKKAEQFFTENTLWIFLTLLLFLSYLLLISVMKDNWTNYILAFGKLCIVYSPVLVFAYFKKVAFKKLPFGLYTALWVICFIAYPPIVWFYCEALMNFLILPEQYLIKYNTENYYIFAQSFLLTTSGAILATELGLLLQVYFKGKVKDQTWVQQLSIDKMLLAIVVILSFSLAVIGTYRVAYGLGSLTAVSGFMLPIKFISFLLQFLIISMLYYFYYYINKHVLIPKLLKKKGLIFYSFSVAAIVLVFYPLFVMFIKHLPIVADLGLQWHKASAKTFTSDGGGIPFLIMLLSLPVIVSNEWFRQSNKIVNLEKEKSNTELNLLKQQINPHFFFNTLNNLYALSITKDRQTPEVILQLSELMRYVIYKGKEDLVSLKDEVKYIEDYIQLQQIRLHKKLDFKFDKNISDPELSIPPLLFITFIENAFKHGIEPAERNCYLHLKISSDQNGLVFSCKNSIEEKNNSEAGIGISNLKRRMELRYPNKHSLETTENKTEFSAQLKLNFK